MPDSFYPTVDIGFIENHVNQSGKLANDGIIKVGSTTTFVQIGQSAIYRRSVMVREIEPGQICLEQAVAVALRFGFLTPLGKWLEDNKNWKDGAYVDATHQSAQQR